MTGVTAQNVYKCGPSTYSQAPCPDGVKLPPTEAPDRTQQKQTEQATARDARTADRLEKERQQQEKRDLKANTPTRTVDAPVPRPLQTRTRAPAKTKDFVAEIPGTEKPAPKRKPKSDQ